MTVWKNQSFVENKMGIIVGFNKFIPNNYLVGCVAVVIGQIMKYHACPESCSLIMGKAENIKTKKAWIIIRLSMLFTSRGDWIRTSDHTPPRRVL